ncbi:Fic family protein [Polynucleobacter sp. JS-Safj-400b-B2]|uniref:Fic family protein n=1 Tax=Polynucleobacter sp. JS-Safj-400b-B2 TaxID=2576921 RepID=UPI001C0CBAE8|nr:Fic family protein [Polynucleobacter sp. JS-Safj-400b-B2]MBU3625067.1 Fic family protein [Polynucleobacter sp. JS-Safj-400b-B2]
MNSGVKKYIWQDSQWPHWEYDLRQLTGLLTQAYHAQGRLLGRLHDIGIDLRDQESLRVLTEDVIKTSEIEGEKLDPSSVRSSIARRLGIDIVALAPADRYVDGVVDMVLDATQHHQKNLTQERLFGWHAALFSSGHSCLSKILVGAWRDDALGPMQVVSGPVSRQQIHFEAPPAPFMPTEMEQFLLWFNIDQQDDPIIKAGLAHLWFVTLHPFDDGNGRIARAIGDMALARADGSAQRFYSLSAQIGRDRKNYYELLEKTQKGALDVTQWLTWFLSSLLSAIEVAEAALSTTLFKTNFWQRWSRTPLNERQIKLLNKLLDGFDGKLTTSKWAIIAKCSPDTALRDITDLLERGALVKSNAGGRSTSYELYCP